MLRTILVIVAVVLVLGVRRDPAISGNCGQRARRDRGQDLTKDQLGAELDRHVRVDCKNEDYPRFTCLAQVAAAGEASVLRPRNATITGRHGGGGGWVINDW